MKLTLQIKLLPTYEQVEILKDTFGVFNEACNVISQIAWERCVFKQFDLHKEVYCLIKETYHLSSQLVVHAISKVANAYKSYRNKKRYFRKLGSITYDRRVLSYKISKSICSISLIKGREKIAYICYRPHLMQFAKGEADLVFIRGKFYIYQTIEIPDERENDVDDFIGVDMGITDIVSISDGTNISSNEVKNIRDKYNKVRASILEYKCKMNGVKIIAVPPAYTSQTCHECKHIGIRNGKRFHCKYCGNIADADINAAMNIATWGYVNTHERWELLSCSIHDDVSTSKTHKSLVYG